MPSECNFTFDRANPVYFSGEIINGTITLRTTKDKDVRGVFIILEGTAKVQWSESTGSGTESTTHNFTAEETYLNTRTCVFGDGTLPAGKHEYTYKIPLPLECPTSCTEKYGKVSYTIRLKLDRPLRFNNVFTRPLIVIKQVNLNYNPAYLIPLMNEDIRYPCCCFFSSGPIITTLVIPYAAWAAGQELPFKLEIDNRSLRDDSIGIKLKLVQTYNFTARRPFQKTRKLDKTIAICERGNLNVLRLSKCNFYAKLLIPPLPPTSRHDNIITVTYRIEMDTYTGTCHTDKAIWIPIVIGTIPIETAAPKAKSDSETCN